MKTRLVEVYRLWPDRGDSGTWDTCYYEIPADTPEEKIEEVACKVALSQIKEECAGVGVYSIPDEDEDEEENEENEENDDE